MVIKNIDKWGFSSPTCRPKTAFVRLRHPKDRTLFYSRLKGDWVRHGWTRWTTADWLSRFGQKEDTFHWEFFGYVIPLLDEKLDHE